MDRIRMITKQGYPLWPLTPHMYDQPPGAGQQPHEVRLRLSDTAPRWRTTSITYNLTCISYVHGIKVTEEEFTELMQTAKVLGPDEDMEPRAIGCVEPPRAAM